MIQRIISQLADLCDDTINRRSVVIVNQKHFGIASDHAFVTLSGKKGNHKFFVKLARTCRDSDRLQHEAEVLKKLRNMGVENIPEIVLSETLEGRTFLAERFIEGQPIRSLQMSGANGFGYQLEWMKGFYAQTREGTIDSMELVRRAEEVCRMMSEFIDLTRALSELERCAPVAKIPAVCRHGDVTVDNLLVAGPKKTAVDFGFARFDEPPCEPYGMVPLFSLERDAKSLDLLSALEECNPLFFAIYENMMRVRDEFLLQQGLQDSLLLTDRMRYFTLHENLTPGQLALASLFDASKKIFLNWA